MLTESQQIPKRSYYKGGYARARRFNDVIWEEEFMEKGVEGLSTLIQHYNRKLCPTAEDLPFWGKTQTQMDDRECIKQNQRKRRCLDKVHIKKIKS